MGSESLTTMVAGDSSFMIKTLYTFKLNGVSLNFDTTHVALLLVSVFILVMAVIARIKINKVDNDTVECKYLISPKFKVGDVVTMSHNKLRDNSGLFFDECSNVDCENITVNYMHGFGWLSQMCENLNFKNITFTPAKG